MRKNCLHCKNFFLDTTKNLNKIYCGSIECKKIQSKTYRLQRNEDKYKANQINFKEKNPNYLKEWRAKNTDRDRELNRVYVTKRYNNDVEYKLRMRLRHRLYMALKNNQKVGSAVKDLGCSILEFKAHLESQFQVNMSWDNYGEWEIDHKRPLISFDLTDRKQFLEACNYSNLQPLWKQINRSKGAKYVI